MVRMVCRTCAGRVGQASKTLVSSSGWAFRDPKLHPKIAYGEVEVLAHLVVAAVFKTVVPCAGRTVGGFDSHALPPFFCPAAYRSLPSNALIPISERAGHWHRSSAPDCCAPACARNLRLSGCQDVPTVEMGGLKIGGLLRAMGR